MIATASPTTGALRVVRRTETRPDYGYTCPEVVEVNVLQRATGRVAGLFPRWVDVDAEDVPSHVSISLGCLGDTGGWRSRFASVDGVHFPTRADLAVQKRTDQGTAVRFALSLSVLAAAFVFAVQLILGGV